MPRTTRVGGVTRIDLTEDARPGDPEWGADVERTGGTRYSEGKTVQCWTPWWGYGELWEHARYREIHIQDATDALLKAEGALRGAIGDPAGFRWLLVRSLYFLTLLLHAHEEGYDLPQGEVDYIPAMGTEGVCRVSVYGAEKYAEFDWHLGQSFSTLMSAAMRHVKKALARGVYSRDPESGLLHLSHAAWNLACTLHFMTEGRTEELDDIGPWRGVSAAEKREMGDD